MTVCYIRTLKASPLSNRRSERPADMSEMITSTLTGSPSMRMGHSFRVHAFISCPGGTTHPRFLDKPSEQVRVLSGDAFSVLCPACYKDGKL